MKALKLTALAFLAALTLASCGRYDDMPGEENEVNPLVNRNDAATVALEKEGIIPCGQWKEAALIDRAGNKYGTAAIINDQNKFYFWISLLDAYQIKAVAAHGDQLEQIPAHDGSIDWDAFTVNQEIEGNPNQTLISLSRRNLENCSAFVVAAEIQEQPLDATLEASSQLIFIDGTPIHDVTAYEYCAQDCE